MTKKRKTETLDFERRVLTVDAPIEIRMEHREEDKDETVINGYAALFNSDSEDFGGWKERIAPGAFSKTLGDDVRALFNHNPDTIMGRTTAKTLRLSEDSRGLAAEITPPDTVMAQHVIEAVRRGDVNQMSFGFRTVKDSWETDGDMAIRTLIEVKLFDVSLVTYPAYPETEAGLRSFKQFIEEQEKENTPEYAEWRNNNQMLLLRLFS